MKNIYLICGIPASGKDWYVENKIPSGEVVSFDNIRIMIFKRDIPDYNALKYVSPTELYNLAWEHCNQKRIDLMRPLISKVHSIFDEGKIPCICNTLLTRKSRASMLSELKKAFPDSDVHVIFLLVNSDAALRRNRGRSTHILSEEVMMRFINGPQELPFCTEGFASVNVVHNG